MANQEHVDLLKKSVEKWNKWREENPEIIPDLSNGNLKKIKCPKAYLNRANLEGANLYKAKLDNSDFGGANLKKAKLYKAVLKTSNFNLADLSEAKLSKADLTGAVLNKATLIRTDLREAILRDVNLENADLSKAELERADLTDATVTEKQLLKAHYSEARFGLRDLPEIYEQYQKRHDECSKDVRRIGLVLLSYAIFCFLALGKAGEKILVDNEVTIPFANVAVDFQTFMIVGPLGLILITCYFHLFIHELHRYQELPPEKRLPFAFNLDNPFAQWLSNLVFYFLTPAVLFVFSVKSRVLPTTGEIWHYVSWVVAAYMIYVYWKHNLNLKKTKWKKTSSII